MRADHADSLAAEAAPLMALPFRRELARKALHLSSVVVPVAYAVGLPRTTLVAALAVLALVALVVELARMRHDALRAHFHGVLGPLLRDHELARWSGATWLVLALLALALWAPRDVAIAGMWAVSVGDAAAALAGRAFTPPALPPSRARGSKTVVGSAACFVATLIGALALAHLPVSQGLLAAACATAAEYPTSRVDDNVRIAAAVALGLLVWRMTFS
jgi:dolichol kinase